MHAVGEGEDAREEVCHDGPAGITGEGGEKESKGLEMVRVGT